MKFGVFILPAALLSAFLFVAFGCSVPLTSDQDVPRAEQNINK